MMSELYEYFFIGHFRAKDYLLITSQMYYKVPPSLVKDSGYSLNV